MCRITYIAGSGFENRKELLYALMLHNATDHQDDGWGVTDGTLVAKSAQRFGVSCSQLWDIPLGAEHPWLAHLRSASVATGLQVSENHPYMFENFIAVHNGSIRGYEEIKSITAPNTDSWRAFAVLDSLITTYRKNNVGGMSNELLSTLITHWIKTFGIGSVFVFVIMLYDGRTLCVRGAGERQLWYVQHQNENGIIFNTSYEHIYSVLRARGLHGYPIQEVAANSMMIIEGTTIRAEYRLEYTLRPVAPEAVATVTTMRR